jgi:putative transposase
MPLPVAVRERLKAPLQLLTIAATVYSTFPNEHHRMHKETDVSENTTSMYRWRGLNDSERSLLLSERHRHGMPLHSIPHRSASSASCFLITAACYEHKSIIGKSASRIRQFETELIAVLQDTCQRLFAWTVLPNHYHVLVDAQCIMDVLSALGGLHGRSSYRWNSEEQLRGRRTWCNAAETLMKSMGHFFASLNYVHNNAVHHGYVKKWLDWPYCSAHDYIESVGRDQAKEIWCQYPLRDFGKTWDPPDL